MATEEMSAIVAKPMETRPGWNYETPTGLYQLWPPVASRENPHEWCASWTERREASYYADDYDDGWRPDCDFGRGATPAEALSIFPTSSEAEQARQALLTACQRD